MITLNRRIVLFAFLIAALSFISCEKDDDSPDDSSQTQITVNV